MESIKIKLGPACSGCPVVKISDAGVSIGEMTKGGSRDSGVALTAELLMSKA